MRVVLGGILNTVPIITNYATGFLHLGKSQGQYIQNLTNEPCLRKTTIVNMASPLQGKSPVNFAQWPIQQFLT